MTPTHPFTTKNDDEEHEVDEVFAAEQAHLSATHARLSEIRDELEEKRAANEAAAAADVHSMNEELTLDFADDVMDQESLTEMKGVSDVIDLYNQRQATLVEDLRRAYLLLQRPYFAKVTLYFPRLGKEDDVYIGRAGMGDPDTMEQIVVDWRSPVAETYYNQSTGATSYVANGREISCDLRVRRQFDIEGDQLNACFDTTVAIQDPLLLKALSSQHSDKLRDITQTIQREQNEIVRHDDVPAMLVNGIAGSGKTSVMLQRIAWLLYQDRKTLDAGLIRLFTPSPLFASYIADVLPGMGERNPRILTWSSFAASLDLGGRAAGGPDSAQQMRRLEELVEGAQLEAGDLRPLRVGGRTLVSVNQIKGVLGKFKRISPSPRLAALAGDELHARLDSRVKKLAHEDSLRREVEALDIPSMMDVFGRTVDLDEEDDETAARLLKRYAEVVYGQPAHELVDAGAWIAFDKLGMRLLGAGSLDAPTWMYLRLLVADVAEREVRYVMVDEVQDYSEAQLMVLAAQFPRAHFLLLGDENQAIREGCASFSQVKDVFAASHGEVCEMRLATSYRCTPQVTDLFTTLLADGQHVHADSVQREGAAPDIAVAPDEDAYLAALRKRVDAARDKEGLCAVIAPGKKRARALAAALGDVACVADEDDPLPASGVFVIDLLHAKGLEFDRVVVADADARIYPAEDLARRRLYTAISRATSEVSVLACGTLTPLLQQK